MLEMAISNRDRQEEEVLALSSIYSYKEFSYSKEDIIQCYYNIFPTVDNDFLRFENVWENFNFHLFHKYRAKHLPPVRVYLQLPANYPTKEAPNFYIISSWLSPWQISFICQKMDTIWLKNKGQEVLFLWFEFLRNDLLDFLNIKDTLDVSFMRMVYSCITNYFKLTMMLQCDFRAVFTASFFDPIVFLVNYDKYQHKTKFENNWYICNICFDEYYGRQCIRLENCNHIYCKKCVQQYIATKINENDVNDITCPDISCSLNITFKEVQELCPELFSRYDNLLLIRILNTMKDVVFCPRSSCQCPVIRNKDDTLAICSKCDYSFCTYCKKVYHGVAPCAMTQNDMSKLIEEYQNSSAHQKKVLEKKYGRKQIQIVVEKYLTNKYLKKYTKPCPNCSTSTVKIDGCNKMTCNYCKAYFCWLCGMEITTQNAYDHFLSFDNTCYKRLFE